MLVSGLESYKDIIQLREYFRATYKVDSAHCVMYVSQVDLDVSVLEFGLLAYLTAIKVQSPKATTHNRL
jgi:hypothetical protein